MLGFVGAIWGLVGVSILLVWAVVRLTPYTIELWQLDLQWYHWGLLLTNIIFMAYTEGYKGFQLGAAPRLGARIRYLYQNPTLMHVIFGPLFCCSYFHTTLRRLISRYIMTIMIIALIIVVSRFQQPWRGIVDAGVVIGLAWGLVSILYYGTRALLDDEFNFSPELPGSSATILNKS